MDRRLIKQPIILTTVIAAIAIGLGVGLLITRLIALPRSAAL